MLFENHIWAFENDVNWKEKNKLLQINHWQIFWVLFHLGFMILWTISEIAMDLVAETDIYVKKNHIIRAIANLCSLFQTMKKRSI